MIKKRILAVASLAVILGGTIVYGISSKTLSAAAYDWQDITVEDTYSYGDTFTVPARTISVGGAEVTATHSLIRPDGSATAASSVVLNSYGTYRLNYYASVNGKQYSDEVDFSVNAIAYSVSNTSLSSAKYGEYTELEANSEGIIVRLANKDALEFSSVIDMSNCSLSDSLVEGFITPDVRGTYDFDRLIFTFTDIEDASVYLKFQLNRYQSSTVGLNTSFVLVGGNEQDMVGYEKDETGKNPHVNDGVGTPVEGLSFIAQKNANGWDGAAQDYAPDTKPFAFYYDAETNSTYAHKNKISVLDDSMYYKTFWTGFPSGKARLTITAGGYSGTTANFCITKVAGLTTEDLKNNTYTETEGPDITINTTYEEMPVAQVGMAYTLPTATAYDAYTGSAAVTASVWYGYSYDYATSAGIVDGKFVPTKAGYYTIVYSATDGFGNTSKKTLSVRAISSVPDLEVSLENEPATSAELGRKVKIATPTIEGGSGSAALVVTMTHNGITTEITDGFTPEESGSYTITYTATDYLGKVGTYTYTIEAKAGTAPILNESELYLPKVFISGNGYTLPTLYADDYTTGKHVKTLVDVKVTDANGEKTYKAGDRIVPQVNTSGDTVKVVYYSGSTSLDAVYVPTIVGRNNKTVNIPSYFYGDVTAAYGDKGNNSYFSGIEIRNDEASESAGWTFANPVAADSFSIDMETLKGYTLFDAFELTLTDSADYSKAISLTITAGASATISHAGSSYKTNNNLTSGVDITISYSGGVVTAVLGKTTLLITITKYTDGSAFDGFASGKVYAGLSTTNNQAGGKYLINQFCENVITSRNRDNAGPNVTIFGNLPSKVSIGETFMVSKAEAVDVFAPESSLTITVYDPDGEVAKSVDGVKLENVVPNKEYVVKAEKYGQYKVVYTATETNWLDTTSVIEQTVRVPDEVAPTLKFTSIGTTEASVGDVIVMPDFAVSDNLTPTDRIKVWKYVINPNGRTIALDGDANSIKCSYAGTYTFVIYVADVTLGETEELDTINNVAIYKYTVTVK